MAKGFFPVGAFALVRYTAGRTQARGTSVGAFVWSGGAGRKGPRPGDHRVWSIGKVPLLPVGMGAHTYW